MAESAIKTGIVSAVLTGIFTLAATGFAYWLANKQPELDYSVSGGPSLPAASGAKRIFVLEVNNSGSKEVAQAFVQLSLKDGELAEVAAEASPGVKVVQDRSSRQLNVQADLLNPGDAIKIAFLTQGTTLGTEPVVVVRAPGLKAVNKSQKSINPSEDTRFLLFAATLASGVAALLSTLLRRSKWAFLRKLGAVESSSLDQTEICAYICGECGLYEEADKLRFAGSEITYRGVADYLSVRAAQFPELRGRYVTCLKAMLLNKSILDQSIKSIVETIEKVIGGPMALGDIQILQAAAISEGKDPLQWRKLITNYVTTDREASVATD